MADFGANSDQEHGIWGYLLIRVLIEQLSLTQAPISSDLDKTRAKFPIDNIERYWMHINM